MYDYFLSKCVNNVNNNELDSIYDLSCNQITTQKSTDIGNAHIVSIPEGAKIYIDNKYIEMTTPAIIPLSSGIHTYKLTYNGYVGIDGLLFITVGQLYELFIVMEKYPYDTTGLLLFIMGAGLFTLFLTRTGKEKMQQEKSEQQIKIKKLKEKKTLL